MNIDAVRVKQALQGEYGGDDFAVGGRGQPADDVAQARAAPVIVATSNELGRERHGSPPTAGVVSTHTAPPILGIVEAARQQLASACSLDDVGGTIAPPLRPLGVERDKEMQALAG